MRAATPPAGAGLLWHLQRTIGLAAPVMLARAGLLIMTTVDAVMIGRVSGEGLAFYGLATAPFLFFMLTGIGALIGTVVLVSQAHGVGDLPRCGIIWRLGLVLAAVYAVPVTALLMTGPALLALLGQSPTLAAGGGEVLRAMSLGLLPMLVFAATSFFLEGLGRPGPGMVVMLAANVVNAWLNALFLFGWFGLPESGAAGAALATSLTRWLMAAALVIWVFRVADRATLGVHGPLRDGRAQFAKLVRLGVPIAVANGLESGAFSAMSMFAGWLGTVPAAAYLVCLNLASLIYMLALGLGTAASVRVGNAVGRGDGPGVAIAGWTAVGLGLAVTFVLAPALWLFRAEIAAAYTTDPAVIAHALPAVALLGVLIVVDAAQGILMGALRGTGDVRLPLAVQGIAYVVVAVPVGHVLAFTAGFGIEGLIGGLTAGLATAALLLGLRFLRVSRERLDAL